MGHYVYKYVFNGEIIYIGKCDSDLDQRLGQHGKFGDNIDKKYWDDINASDIYYCTLANATMSDVVESELINRYKPKCNTAKISNWDGLKLPEPKWKKYNKPKKILFARKKRDLLKNRTYMIEILRLFDSLGGKKIKIIKFMLENMSKNDNTLKCTRREIAKLVPASKRTVDATIKLLAQADLIKCKRGLIMISPRFMNNWQAQKEANMLVQFKEFN